MKTARELFGDDGYRYGISYEPIIEALAEEHGPVLLRHDDTGYDGDTHVVFGHAGGAVTYLCFGWGSCSGCDAAEAVSSEQDADALITHLAGSVELFDSLELFRAELHRKGYASPDYRWQVKEFVEGFLPALDLLVTGGEA